MPSRRSQRRALGPCNLLTVDEAIAELAMTDAVARSWLRDRGLVRTIAGRCRVVAGDLAEAVRSSGSGQGRGARAPTLPRRKL